MAGPEYVKGVKEDIRMQKEAREISHAHNLLTSLDFLPVYFES